jgi:hypothetical protein
MAFPPFVVVVLPPSRRHSPGAGKMPAVRLVVVLPLYPESKISNLKSLLPGA